MIKVNNNIVEIDGTVLRVLAESDSLLTHLLTAAIPKSNRIFAATHLIGVIQRIAENDFDADKVRDSLIKEVLEKAHEK